MGVGPNESGRMHAHARALVRAHIGRDVEGGRLVADDLCEGATSAPRLLPPAAAGEALHLCGWCARREHVLGASQQRPTRANLCVVVVVVCVWGGARRLLPATVGEVVHVVRLALEDGVVNVPLGLAVTHEDQPLGRAPAVP